MYKQILVPIDLGNPALAKPTIATAAIMDIERLKRTIDLHCAVLDVRQFRSNLAPCRCSQAKPIQA